VLLRGSEGLAQLGDEPPMQLLVRHQAPTRISMLSCPMAVPDHCLTLSAPTMLGWTAQ
jgi:hypothetical protein